VIIGMIGCVGNGDGVIGMNVGEIAIGTSVSVGRAVVCCPQAARKARRTIQKYRCGVGFMCEA